MKEWLEKHPKAAQWIREGGLFLLFSYVVTFIKMLLLMFLPALFHGIVGDAEFAELLGHPIPDGSWSGTLQMNDAICQLYYAKSWPARQVYKIMTNMLNKSMAKGKPDLNIIFIYNMPFRAIGKMAGGAVSQKMCEDIVKIVNGHFFKGVGGVIGGFFKQRKVQKKANSME